MNKFEVLKKYFGYDTFREGQEKLIDSLLSGRDVLGIMPTGAGKSLCYQIPAIMLPGITIVVSPLISLMKDQVNMLNSIGIRAAYLNSSLTEKQFFLAIERAKQGTYKIIYVAPERLETPVFRELLKYLDISMTVIDEAHCISQWGQDFRPSYLNIIKFINSLGKRPVVGAFTATATLTVKEDILNTLCLDNPTILVTGFDRKNLHFEVRTPRSKLGYIRSYVAGNLGQSGIIYCSTRKNVDAVYEALLEDGHKVSRYHAGMSGDERQKSQDSFIYDETPVIVATNAFGMGINKSNVRYVIHYNMPQSIENYYQEAGRAGRDSMDAVCILLYAKQDVVINRLLLKNKDFKEDVSDEQRLEVAARDNERLKQMTFYCTTKCCLRKFLLNYFGENAPQSCNSCSNCLGISEDFEFDYEYDYNSNYVAEPTKKILKSVSVSNVDNDDKGLFEELKKSRLQLARESHLPPYMVFSDKTLMDMCSKKPFSKEEMLQVHGVGLHKFEKYGEFFLDVINNYLGGSHAHRVIVQQLTESEKRYSQSKSDAERKKRETTIVKRPKKDLS